MANTFITRHDWPVFFAKVRAIASLQRAIDTLIFKGDQWERGDAALALQDATNLLRSRIKAIEAEL